MSTPSSEPRVERRPDTGTTPSARQLIAGLFLAPTAGDAAWKQFLVVAHRFLLLVGRDPRLMATMLAQPILLGLLVGLTQYDVATNKVSKITFFAVVIAIWLGLNNSARDLVRDRRHYLRDRLAGLRPIAYLGARAAVHAAVGAVQIAILLFVLRVIGELVLDPEVATVQRKASLVWMTVILMLSYLGGVGLGLLVSALSRTEEAAVALLPLLIMPQLLLSAVATNADSDPYPRRQHHHFQPLFETLKSRPESREPADLVNLISMGCLSRPATLVAEALDAKDRDWLVWLIGDLSHLLIMLLSIWALLLVVFAWVEQRWLRLIDVG